MSVREANCPSCGASIAFANAAAVMVVCPHCGTASVRKDAVLEKIGRVAEIAPIESAVSLGSSGRWRSKRFTVVGQVQLDHGKGPWNEWAILFEDGRCAWLAEAQGEFFVTLPYAASDAADQPLGVGSKISVAGETLVVVEAGSARVTTARGELPEDLRPGTTYQYFDLRGPNDRFGTIAVTGDGAFETWLGWSVPREALGIDASTVAAAAPRRATPDRVGCPSCGAPIQIRDPANTKRVVCASCGAMTDPRDRKLRVIEKAAEFAAHPTIAVGSKGRLKDQAFEVLAYLRRSVVVAGVAYPWTEYLLRRADGAYRWLVCTNGHWTLTEPVNVGATTHNDDFARYGTMRFKHFQSGEARVDLVLGEVYWEVSVGETVDTIDYVVPPEMLSFEISENEVVASLCGYVTTDEMAAAFPGVPRWPPTRGVAPNQPNPWSQSLRAMWKLCGVLALVLFLTMGAFNARSDGRQVARIEGRAPVEKPGATPAAEDAGVAFSDEFKLTRPYTNLEIRLTTDVSNEWLGVDGALVDLDRGEVRAFAVTAELWSGVEDGERWTEGSRTSTVSIGAVPEGRYALRIDAEAQSTSRPGPLVYSVSAIDDAASWGLGFLALALIALPPIVLSFVSGGFETQRWSTSDHPVGGDDE